MMRAESCDGWYDAGKAPSAELGVETSSGGFATVGDDVFDLKANLPTAGLLADFLMSVNV